MKNTRFLQLLLLVLVSCNQKQEQKNDISNESLPVLNLARYIDKNVPDTFTWNSIQKKVTFIPLETTEASLVTDALYLAYIDEKVIIIGDPRTNTILKYDHSGKCITQFNHFGNGPGEYISFSGIYYSPFDSLIYVYDRDKCKWIQYSAKGMYLKSISTKDKFKGGINYFKGNRIITRNFSGKSRISIFDKDFNLIQGVFPLDTTQSYKAQWQINCFSNTSNTKDIMLYNNSVETDTVYAFSDTNVWPLFIVDKGNYVISDAERSDYFKAFLELNPTYPKDFHFDIFSPHALITYLYKGLIVAEMWDLTSEKILSCCRLQNVVTNKVFSDGFAYTLPSGRVIHTLPKYVTQHRLVFQLSPEDLMDDIPGLKEDDNPVLMILDI